ncbi:peroxisomal N(1)-acetyl-spermine/spermidine oxidase-like [Hyposmocoma kahamanoa]|uniref:peroxisomal N(1)-acetyl-spermine/spermidine oxidase-like n=1 Tax=Hyposmocoma kahamanoa TaxID=1477025 RepID=UPI000E6D825A|nr:peroxisomal N(1)-acetyl-spermine/spermidine oxidase-like [Hyposmocoma kahamanoa]
MRMKLSRVKILLQGGVRFTLKCIEPKDGGVMALAFMHRGKSTAVSSGQEYCIMDSSSIRPNVKEPRVIIVGAGIAGLSAAHRLTQCGIRNFVVLEAKERPGGRIHSCWLGDSVIEMGAEWIYGACLPNSVYTLASNDRLLQSPLPRLDPSRGLFCTSEGRAVDFPVTITAYHTFRQIEQQAANLFRLGGERCHGTLLNFLGLRIQQELHNFPEDQRYDAARVMFGLTNLLRNRCGDDLSLVSADQYGSYIELPGGNVRVPLGFVGVVAPLLRGLPENTIRYSKPVSVIRWGTGATGPGRVMVKCCDGEEMCGDYIIITLSLGCLKCQADKLFSPPLPVCKLDAICNLGYGLSDKIFLEYAEPFWVCHEGSLKLGWSAEELACRCDWTRGVCSIDEMPGSKHVLCAWISGQEAAMMESMSESDVAEGITQLLRRFTGNPCLPYPEMMLRSRWASDPHFCGAYSYMSCCSTVSHQCELGTPVPGPCDAEPPKLMFAGEATVPGYFATVHGARLSGIREAERIVLLTKKFEGPPCT